MASSSFWFLEEREKRGFALIPNIDHTTGSSPCILRGLFAGSGTSVGFCGQGLRLPVRRCVSSRPGRQWPRWNCHTYGPLSQTQGYQVYLLGAITQRLGEMRSLEALVQPLAPKEGSPWSHAVHGESSCGRFMARSMESDSAACGRSARCSKFLRAPLGFVWPWLCSE